MPSVLGNGLLLGVALAGAQYTGGAIFSHRPDPDEDKFAKKEEIRRRFRRPVNEMINEIGEGRGISPRSHASAFGGRMQDGSTLYIESSSDISC